MLHLSRSLTSLFRSGCSEATNPSLHCVCSGAVRVNDHSVFNSYGIASFVFNEAEFGGAMSHVTEGQEQIRFLDMSPRVPMRHARM